MGVLDNQRIRKNGNRKLRRRISPRHEGGGDLPRWRPFRWLKRDPRDVLADRPRGGNAAPRRERGPGGFASLLGRLGPFAREWIVESWEGTVWLAVTGARLAAMTAVLLGRGALWSVRWTLRMTRLARPHVARGAKRSAVLGKRVASGTRVRIQSQADYMQDGFPDVREGVSVVRRGVDGARKQVARNVARVDWLKQLGWPGLRRVLRAAGTGLALGVATALGIGAVLLGPAALEESDALAVREVVVSGNQRIPHQAILDAAGVQAGDDLNRIDLEKVADQVRGLPWVESVSLRRRYPDRFAIEVVEREPSLLLADGQLWFVDRRGEVFKAVEPGEWQDLPVVTGLTLDARVGDPEGSQERLRNAQALVEAIGETEHLGVEDIGEIQLLPSGEFLVRTMGEGVALELDPVEYSRGLRRLDALLGTQQLDLDGVTDVDLSLRNQVVAVKKAER